MVVNACLESSLIPYLRVQNMPPFACMSLQYLENSTHNDSYISLRSGDVHDIVHVDNVTHCNSDNTELITVGRVLIT